MTPSTSTTRPPEQTGPAGVDAIELACAVLDLREQDIPDAVDPADPEIVHVLMLAASRPRLARRVRGAVLRLHGHDPAVARLVIASCLWPRLRNHPFRGFARSR